MGNKFKKGDHVRWAAKFLRGKDPNYGLIGERMIIIRKHPRYAAHPYETRVISHRNKGQFKYASAHELIKID